MMESKENEIELQKVLNTLKLRKNLIGIGGAGCNIIRKASEVDMQGVGLIAIDADISHLDIVPIENKYLICKDPTGGFIFSSVEGHKEDRDTIDEILEKTDITFLVCGLGGSTGTAAAPMVAEIAREHCALIFAICVLPFKVEGAKSGRRAEKALTELEGIADTVVSIKNDRLLETYPKLDMVDAFGTLDDLIVRFIKAVIDPISSDDDCKKALSKLG